MKVYQIKTPEEFDKITQLEFYKLYYMRAWTLKMIATYYGVDLATVKEKKKDLHITTLGCAMWDVAGNEKFKSKKLKPIVKAEMEADKEAFKKAKEQKGK